MESTMVLYFVGANFFKAMYFRQMIDFQFLVNIIVMTVLSSCHKSLPIIFDAASIPSRNMYVSEYLSFLHF